MASNKEIKGKISSINNTRKITKAMEMVAASKMRKAKDKMLINRPYTSAIEDIIHHLSAASSEYTNKYMCQRDLKAVGIVVVATDRGLCAGLNANLFRKIKTAIAAYQKDGVKVQLCALGTKAHSFCKSMNADLVASSAHLAEKPVIDEIVGAIDLILAKYAKGEIDKLEIASNHFVILLCKNHKLNSFYL
jgi:F-type H+-transporting ATPase subunit gamma